MDRPDKDPVIRVHKLSFGVIIRNLIENAVKFNDKDIIRIEVGVKEMPEKVEISISDNGRGIPPEYKEKIFDGFYQIEKDYTGNVPGAGLGLTLVRRFVKACGGEMDMKSEIGKGTTFIIILPK